MYTSILNKIKDKCKFILNYSTCEVKVDESQGCITFDSDTLGMEITIDKNTKGYIACGKWEWDQDGYNWSLTAYREESF